MQAGLTLSFRIRPFGTTLTGSFWDLDKIKEFIDFYSDKTEKFPKGMIDKETVRITSADGERTYDIYKKKDEKKAPSPKEEG